jgi:predicted PurR-regulated permease PerM
MTTESSTGMDTAIKISLLAVLALSCFLIARPFISLIAWAGIIAIAVFPLFRYLKSKTGLSDGWASTILTIALLVLLIGPSTVLTSALVKNTQALQAYLTDDELVIPPPGDSIGDWPIIGDNLEALWQEASEDPTAIFGQYEAEIVKLLNWLGSTALVTGLNILLLVFSIIVAGLFMASASSVKEAFLTVFTRVAGDQGTQLTHLAYDTVQSVVRGILGIAVLQALLAGIGFVVMGIPASGILAVICLILAIVQIDILLILIPLSIYEFTNPEVSTGVATLFLIWNIAVGLLNNVLKPILLAQGVEAPMAVIFIGAIGGMMLTGIIGLFIGAVVMVLGYTLFMSWVRQQV